MSQKEEPEAARRSPPTTVGALWADDVDEPVSEVTGASESVEMLTDLVSDPARAAVVAERLAALEAEVAGADVRSRAPATLRAYRPDCEAC